MPLKFSVYFLLLILTAGAGLISYRRFARPDRIIVILIVVTLINEILSFAADKLYHNNLPLYHIFCPIELFTVSLYFDRCVHLLRRRRIALVIGIAGIPLSILNTIFIQDIRTINSTFLLFEGIVIIMYSLLSLHQILLDEEHLPYRFAQFWITVSFLIYWSFTFTGWGIYTVLDRQEFVLNPIFIDVLVGVNYILYLGIAFVFIRYKKLIPSGA